eukprot:TRINITY_DN2044_c5_g1_i1.p1 TRINITY_DN2044_c5_g1~~TRINITY_DN2044_c5_g1_i1.p1  ORF type:complete len:477 (-),score=89.40 TRINITY_DN2044_c5_g1_i1:2679-4109(-)
MAQWFGQLIVEIFSGSNLAKMDMFSASDPYCLIKVTTSTGTLIGSYKTNVVTDNCSPVWKELYSLKINPMDVPEGDITILIEIFDAEDIGKDQYMGEITFTISPDSGSNELQDYPVDHRKKKGKGTIRAAVSFISHDIQEKIKRDKLDTFHTEGEDLDIVMGPVLLFRGLDADTKHYKIGILFLVNGENGDNANITINPRPVTDIKKTHLLQHDNYHLWVYDYATMQLDAPYRVKYSLNGSYFKYWIPAVHEDPRFTVTSCNGFHEDESLNIIRNHPNKMWEEMLKHHESECYHLCLQNGDQVYADPLWSEIPQFSEKKYEAGTPAIANDETTYTPEVDHLVSEFYLHLYRESWSGEFMSEAMARIPNIMMWDDHDIFDGWGSYIPSIQNSGIYQGIWQQAQRYFCAFQLGCTMYDLPEATLGGDHDSYTQVYDYGRCGMIMIFLMVGDLIYQAFKTVEFIKGYGNKLRDISVLFN